MNRTVYLFTILLFSLISCQQASQFNFGSPTETGASKTPDNLKIAYNVLENVQTNDYEIYVMNADGSNKTNISNQPGVDWVYYSYGTKLYFVSDRDTTSGIFFLYEMEYDGSEIRKITDFRIQDSWFSSRNSGQEFVIKPHDTVDSTRFYIIDMDGEVLEQIEPGLPYIYDPHFSPTGDQIVFRGSRSPYLEDSGYIDELYIINTDGSGLRQLTQYPENDSSARWWSYHAGPPRWKQEQNRITYNSIQKGTSSLFEISPDGSDQTQITSDSTYDGWHSWSEDGEWLVFSRSVVNGGSFNYDIYLRKQNSDEVLRVTTSPKIEQAPVFVRSE
ncbi:TolB family protein [Balneola sp. MJW-20]|uniref:TolB family protein n=1 Tax=Gracilimonas aurantiaca TaxID=3234185 RepID=UPI00346725E2